MDLITQIQELSNEINSHVRSLQNYGLKRANAEREYQTVLAQTALKLNDEGMKATLIDLTIKGRKEVAEKRLERDIADVMYTVAQEKINIAKLQLRVLDNQAQREWSVRE